MGGRRPYVKIAEIMLKYGTRDNLYCISEGIVL